MSHFIIFLFSDFSFGILMDTDSAGLPEFFPIELILCWENGHNLMKYGTSVGLSFLWKIPEAAKILKRCAKTHKRGQLFQTPN